MHGLLIHLAQLSVPIPTPAADTPALQNFFNIVLSIAGAVALLVMTLAGFRYVTSHGTPQDISQSKSAIIYSLVGLVVIM
jgi:hypothetical protein